MPFNRAPYATDSSFSVFDSLTCVIDRCIFFALSGSGDHLLNDPIRHLPVGMYRVDALESFEQCRISEMLIDRGAEDDHNSGETLSRYFVDQLLVSVSMFAYPEACYVSEPSSL